MTYLISNILKYFEDFKNGQLTSDKLDALNNNIDKLLEEKVVIFWISYIENGVQKFERIHNNFEGISGVPENDEIIRTLTFSLHSKEVIIYYSNFLYAHIMELEKSLPDLKIDPELDPSFFKDYTQRDYFAAFRSLVNLISLISPDLASLITERNSPDYLFLDAMAFLYDRLQFYIDYAVNLHNIDQASGDYLDLFAKFYSIPVTPPQPSILSIPVVLFEKNDGRQVRNIISYLIDLVYNKSSSDTVNVSELYDLYPYNNSENYYSKVRNKFFDNISLIFKSVSTSLLENYFTINLPDKVKTDNQDFMIKNSVFDLIFSLDHYVNSDNVERPKSFISYSKYESISDTYTIDFKITRELKLPDRYIDLNTLTITVNDPNIEFYLISDLTEYHEAINLILKTISDIEEGIKPQNYIVIPVYAEINRFGEVTLKFLHSPLVNYNTIAPITFSVSYAKHNGARDNNAKYTDKSQIYTILSDNNAKSFFNDIEILLEDRKGVKILKNFGDFLMKLKDANIIAESKPNNISSPKPVLTIFYDASMIEPSSRGTGPLTDEELRSILRFPLKENFFTADLLNYLKRAVVEEDYEILLKLQKKVPVLTAKIIQVSDVSNYDLPYFKEVITPPVINGNKRYKYIVRTAFPYRVELYVLGKSHEYKELLISPNRTEEVLLVQGKKLDSNDIYLIKSFLKNYNLLTTPIKVEPSKIVEVYIKGKIYSENPAQTKLDIIDTLNAITLSTKIGEKLTKEKILTTLMNKSKVNIYVDNLDFSDLDAKLNQMDITSYMQIKVKIDEETKNFSDLQILKITEKPETYVKRIS